MGRRLRCPDKIVEGAIQGADATEDARDSKDAGAFESPRATEGARDAKGA